MTPSSDGVEPDVDESVDVNDENATSRWCEDDAISSIELAMGTSKRKQSTDASSRPGRRWSDDHYDGVVLESVNYLLSDAFGIATSVHCQTSLVWSATFGPGSSPGAICD